MKKMLIGVLAALVLIGSLTVGVSATTKSAEDVYFDSFTITPFNFRMPGGYMPKDNNTSVYVYLTDATNYRYPYVKVRAYGTGGVNLTLAADGETRRDSVRCYLYREHEVYNSIWESYYRSANIGLQSCNYVDSQTVTGRWSADTIGHFEVAN